MKNPDEAIDRMLKGLRDAEAPQGMERRILEVVSQSAPAHSRWTSVFLKAQPWAIAAAAAIVVSLAASLALHRNHQVDHAAATPKLHTSPAVTTAQTEVAATIIPQHKKSLGVSLQTTTAPKTEAISDEDALAISEMLAPSKPAPPLPLTHQEKLLAEVVHHGAPEELATLRPDVRARQIEISKAEFHDFFEPPPVKDNE
jgi:hypothetical protein